MASSILDKEENSQCMIRSRAEDLFVDSETNSIVDYLEYLDSGEQDSMSTGSKSPKVSSILINNAIDLDLALEVSGDFGARVVPDVH